MLLVVTNTEFLGKKKEYKDTCKWTKLHQLIRIEGTITIRANKYSLRPEILVKEMDVFKRILVIDTSNFIHLSDEYFGTEGVLAYIVALLDKQILACSLLPPRPFFRVYRQFMGYRQFVGRWR